MPGDKDMIEIKIETWNKFKEEITKIFSEYDDLRKQKSIIHIPAPLFRGHGDSAWKLESTLEREANKSEIAYKKYYYSMNRAQSPISTLTHKEWVLPTPEEFDQSIKDERVFSKEVYSYMVYLRHHGFPSPLLDWSQSPYVAAYFAYRDATEDNDVAICFFLEHKGTKTFCEDYPRIIGLGSYVNAHKRHYLQQSEYTLCVQKIHEKMHYVCHENVIQQSNADQDVLVKYVLPSSERGKVLKELNLMNINDYSLFGNEDSLIKSMALKEFVIDDRRKWNEGT